MIPKKMKARNRLSKTTIQAIRGLARKGSDSDLENFIYQVAMEYIAEVRGTDYIEEEDYLNIKDKKFETECPYCHEMMILDLKEIINDVR